MSEHVLVLRDEVSLTVVHALAELEAWELREETGRAHLLLASRRWSTPMGEEITYVADHTSGAQSLRVSGPGAAATADRLRGRILCEDEGELLAMAMEGEPGPCVRVAGKLAACRPERAEERHLTALRRLLEHPEVAVRRAAIRSAYGCRWPELRDVVEARQGEEKRLQEQLEGLRAYLAEPG
ncbi:hypothetical protein [Paraliomyxa miuraensis]|uniref:hypothetical protein n=1 Tax=Paraliomyxa miuraensis TaxID=376150 RepID=UPI00224D24AC|nr:hypothetical protein [Paraliomyxa miuraensis]MCX4245072.1 hypothetical protein [Paraliomyxa miuraensis]